MKKSQTYLALDLGAGSGRAMLGRMNDHALQIEEIHRFANQPVQLPDGFHWDVLYLWKNILDGLRLAIKHERSNLVSIGVDTWGVDFALLDSSGALLLNPYFYLDGRTEGMLEEAFKRMPRQEIFDLTGVQFLRLNTLYQLLAMVVNNSPLLRSARTFLMLPDLFNYWLSGSRVCEFTGATTSQCMNSRQRDWAWPLLEKMDIPKEIFPPVVLPGTLLGSLTKYVSEETGAPEIKVVAPACHDTGSAVAAVPATAKDYVWISSGTWSIMGVEVDHPVITPQVLASNLANEGGVNGTFRLSKNLAAMWLLQECRRTWAREGQDISYSEMEQIAARAHPLQSIIDPDAQDFMAPGDMPARLRLFCSKNGQNIPEDKAAIVRCVLEGIALKYRWILEQLQSVLGKKFDTIHIVGGGTQNQLLSQFTADATGCIVHTGPVEATATGNILMQAIALGQITSLDEGRELVRRSYPPRTYQPRHTPAWDEAYTRLLDLLSE